MFPELLIQIAGVIDIEEANMLCDLGVPYLGFPLRLPDGREDLSEAAAAFLISRLPPANCPVLITYLHNPQDIISFGAYLGVQAIQLHGEISLEEIKLLSHLRPDWFLIKSLVVSGDNADKLEQDLEQLSPYVNAFITDTYDPATGRKGATGKTHNWDVSKRLVELSEKPIILAGGLTAENVHNAIAHVRPAGVDAHTGVERPDGRKDPLLVQAFMQHAIKALTS